MKSVGLNKNKTAVAAVVVAAGILYALISLVNHYLFKTYALDLGLYSNFMYEYSHFHRADLFMLNKASQSAMSAHFDLWLVILSPLMYVFGSYTLLVIQIAAVLLGGWGVYKLIGLYTDDKLMPVLAMASFFLSFGILHAFGYDYHSNVVSTMMLPWMLYEIKKSRFGWAALFAVLLVIGKENLSLWLIFIALGLMWDYRKDRKALWFLSGCALFATIYFVVVNMVLMPRLGARGIMRYEYLGSNYYEIAKNLIFHPGETLRILFTNTGTLHRFDGVKAEFYFCALASGMLLTLLKPNYLLMLVPLLAQKMLAADGMFWGITAQYSVEFVPVLVVSSFLVIMRLSKRSWRRALSIAFLVSVVLTTCYSVRTPRSFLFTDQIRVCQARHYQQRKFDAKFARELLSQIPDDAYVCASTQFVPHLALRHQIEDFTYNRDTEAEYVLLLKGDLEKVEKAPYLFKNKADYETIATDSTLFLLKRR